MKKQFFYAAMAVALMASCTSEDSPVVDPITPDAEDKVAIELGVDAPSVNTTVVSKSVGSVGDTEESGENKWNGQQLYITMVDQAGKVVQEGNDALLGYNTYNYYAPTGAESGLIKVYDKNQKNEAGAALIKNVYYPVSGTYDFYGWHVDDSNGTPNATDPLLIENIKIDGSQDIMGARTKAFTEDNYGEMYKGASFGDMIGWDFSARTARNGIKPILKFEHQLARLKFFVRAGSENTLKNDKLTGAATEETGAMKVTSIVAKNLADNLTMDLDADGAILTSTTDGAEGTLADFKLKTRVSNKMEELVPVAPTKVYDSTDETSKGEQVGESIMFFPTGTSKEEIELLVNLQQYVEIYEDETLEEFEFNENYWDHKKQEAKLKILASSVKLEGSSTPITEFEAGKSYNVYITVYGFERIEVSAELTAWEMGGDVDVDVEEGTSKRPVDLSFNVTGVEDGVTPEITVEQAGETIEVGTDGKYQVESFTTVKYTISADGYETVSSYVNPENGGKTVTLALRAGQAMTITASPSGRSITPNTITVTEKGTANTVPANAQGTYNMAIGATYMIKVEATDYETKTVEHKVVEGTTSVNVEMEAEQPEEDGEDDEEEAEYVQVTFTMPEGVEAATIRVDGMQDFPWTTQNNKMTFAANAESVTATIVIEGYQDITKKFVPSEAVTTGVSVEQSELFANTEEGE